MPPLTGHVHVASSAIPEQLYFLPLLWPEGDQLSATKGKIKKKKISAVPLLCGSSGTAASGFSSYLLGENLLGSDEYSPES